MNRKRLIVLFMLMWILPCVACTDRSITSNSEGQGEIDAIEDVQVHEQQDPNEVEYYGAEDKEGAPSELPKVSESPELIEEAGSQDIVMTTEEPTVDNGSEMWELASLAEVKNSSEQLLVNNTQADKYVVPDKYSTGASGSLKLVRKVEDIKEMIAKVGDGSIKIHLNSEGIKGVITLEDYDFTEFSTFAFMNISNCQNDVTIVFRNCKFNNFKTSVIPSKPKFIMYDCSFVNFYGSNVEFYNCYFGGELRDCTNPFVNCYYENCMFADISHFYNGDGVIHADCVQIYAHKDIETENVHFLNCRFVAPIFSFEGAKAGCTVNTCIGLMIEYNNAKDVSWKHCVVNGGGYSIYLTKKEELTYSDIVLKDIRVGCTKMFGTLYRDKTNGAKYKNVRDTDALYVGSVWKESDGIHLSVTNDTNQERTLTVYTESGWQEISIDKCLLNSEFEHNVTTYKDMPFDIEIVIPVKSDYIVCYDTTTSDTKQIRFVNWGDGDVYAKDYSKFIGKVVIEQ